MLAVYIMSGQFQGYYGYLLKTDGRTCEVACRNKIIRVDTSLLEPLDIANSFDEIEKMVNQLVKVNS